MTTRLLPTGEYLRTDGLQRRSKFVGLETERARLALVHDTAAGVDEVHAIWPAGVGALGHVVEAVEHRWKLDPQLAHASSSDQRAFFLRLRAGEDDLIADVRFHLPDIAGMRLENIDGKESHAVVILVVELVERGNLPAKRWSSIAAKDQDDRLLRGQR